MDARELLDEALARGIITDTQRAELASIAQEEKGDTEERIKPVGTMNEIFVTFGVVLLIWAASGLFSMLVAKDQASNSLFTASIAWLAAVYFHKGKRFRLPVILGALKAAFAFGTCLAFMFLGIQMKFFAEGVPLANSVIPLLGGLAALIAAAVRFRIPFLMLPIGIVFTIIVTYATKYGDDDISYRMLLGISGLTMLALAIAFDLKDPARVKRWSDYAFWSYVIGSPLFVHSLFLSVLLAEDNKEWAMGIGVWALMLMLASIVTFMGLLLNRRALILSTLIYVAFIVGRLLIGLTPGNGAVVVLATILIIGLYVVALGARWTRVRNAAMRKLPAWPWLRYLPA